MSRIVTTLDGWIIDDERGYRLLADHSPPRPYSHWNQLYEDACSWKPIAMWIVGSASVAYGIMSENWGSIALGVAVLGAWFLLFLSAVKFIRNAPTISGVTEQIEPHPLAGFCAVTVRTAEGEQIDVAIPCRLIEPTLSQTGRAEVFVLYDRRSEYSMGIAVRPVR